MSESQFGMKCKEFRQPRHIKIAEVFEDFFYLFSRIDLNDENMKNLSIPGYMKA